MRGKFFRIIFEAIRSRKEQAQDIIKAFPSLRFDGLYIFHFLQQRNHGDHASCQIPAVYDRNISRFKWLQAERVIPVKQMATQSFQPVERIIAIFGPSDEFFGSDISEIPSSSTGEQHHPDIGR